MDTSCVSDSDLLNSALFESITLHATVKNKTTMKNVEPTDTCPISVEEIIENGIILTTPGPSFAREHKVAVHLEPRGTREAKPHIFIGHGKVRELVTFPDGSEKVVIEWSQFDQESWDIMWQVFDQRQKEIDQFLSQVKG